jgi:hypothetical protein
MSRAKKRYKYGHVHSFLMMIRFWGFYILNYNQEMSR